MSFHAIESYGMVADLGTMGLAPDAVKLDADLSQRSRA